MSAWTCRQLSARPPLRSFHLVFEPHDGRALAPIPKRSTSPRVTSAPLVVDSLKALDPNRPIREADISKVEISQCSEPLTGCSTVRYAVPTLGSATQFNGGSRCV